MSEQHTWGSDRLGFQFAWGADDPVRINGIVRDGRAVSVHPVPAVDVLTAAQGHLPASNRLAHTEIGSLLRYTGHEEQRRDGVRTLSVHQAAPGITTSLILELHESAGAAVRARVVVRATGPDPLVLRAVPSLTLGFTAPGGPDDDALAGWRRLHGAADWLGEGRWTTEPLRGPDFPRLASERTGQNPRGCLSVTSAGTWTTGRRLPVGAVTGDTAAYAWQIEHNGPWRWEIGEDVGGGYVSVAGPTDTDAAWTRVLAPGEEFITVPATLAAGDDLTAALAALTDFRRAARAPHPDNTAMPVVFNDYMNTLDGDPTTAKLLPLIAAAAEAGAEVFCVDAGWYDDSGHWWDTVGAWTPSTTRFPGGLEEVVDAIRDAGMVPGLWLEPEVIGVNSPVADTLPAEAFLTRHGQRVVEHHRYHLDLRHPAAVDHLDRVVDRLVADFGVGFFKFDYNVDPGPGTDLAADSVGDGLLRHNRAHLDWLDRLLDRHPDLVIENCSSGAMRTDFAILSRLAMQSTSDQQDFTRFPPIAAAAPVVMLPEQAANWAYPQPEMSAEEAAFCLVTGLLGRYYVSGHLNRMDRAGRRRVADAVAAAKTLRAAVRTGHAHWPAGLPGWDDPWIALGLSAPDDELLSVWHRGGPATVDLRLPHLAGRDLTVTTVFPTDLPAWPTTWDAASATLTVHGHGGLAARTLRLTTTNPTKTGAMQ